MALTAIVSLIPGASIRLGGVAVDAQGISSGPRAVTWASSDPTVATIDANGTVQALKTGTTTITGTDALDSLTATTTVTVVANPPTALKITPIGRS